MASGMGWGMIAQGLTDFANSALGAKFALHMAKKQQSRTIYNYQNRYQWQMEDMRKAGLNPILAMSHTPPALGVPMGPQPKTGVSNYAQVMGVGSQIEANQASAQAARGAAVNSAAMARLNAAKADQEEQLADYYRRVPSARAWQAWSRGGGGGWLGSIPSGAAALYEQFKDEGRGKPQRVKDQVKRSGVKSKASPKERERRRKGAASAPKLRGIR